MAVQPPFQVPWASCEPGTDAGVVQGSAAMVDRAVVLEGLSSDAPSDAISGEPSDPAACDTDGPGPAAEIVERSVDQRIGPVVAARGTSPTPY